MYRFRWRNLLAPFGTTWKKGSGAAPFTIRGLEIKGAISIPTAPTKTAFSFAEWLAHTEMRVDGIGSGQV